MFPVIVLALGLSGAAPPEAAGAALSSAASHFRTIESYRVTIRSVRDGNTLRILYYYRKPGFVRMEFLNPHPGALLIYSPETKRVRLWPFGFGHFPVLDLSPGNPLVRGSGGQHVDHSDVGALFENVLALQARGRTSTLGEEKIEGRTTMHLVTTGTGPTTVAGIHRYDIWLDTASLFPAKVISRDVHDAVLETVLMDGLATDEPLADALFNP